MAGDEDDSSQTKIENTIENPHTLKITTVLTGSENYPLWKRQMELALSAKRKLGYVTGKTVKPKDDDEKIETWVVTNNQVITWILQNVSERIKMVIIYTPTAKGIWDTLEKRYTVANGARKFKLSKESYEIAQNGRSIEEYYTQLQFLQMVWDELDHMTTLPTITKVTTEITEYLTAVEKQAEERKLFQFLNGLDKEYGVLRSNMLLMDPLPSVDHTVSIMLQEEQQTNNVSGGKIHENSAFLSKGESDIEKCAHCGRDNHRSEMCWEKVGYPVGHPRHKRSNFKPGIRGGYKHQRPFQSNVRQSGYKGNAANAKTDQVDLTAAIGAATQHLENLLKMVPNNPNARKSGGDSEEELECNFAGIY